jgi:putative transposase
MGKVRNLFAVAVGRHTNKAAEQRHAFVEAKSIWDEAALKSIFA